MIKISQTRAMKILGRILDSDNFRTSPLRAKFLNYIVLETLEGRADNIKGYSIGVDVYGRSHDFDPQSDPVVRLEASRLRRDLEHYYLTDGSEDDIRLTIPKGRYVPTFKTVSSKQVENSKTIVKDDDSVSLPSTGTSTDDKNNFKATDNNLNLSHVISSRLKTISIIATLLLIVGAVWFTIIDKKGSTTTLLTSSKFKDVVSGPAIYVETFQSVSANSNEKLLARGLSVEITNALSNFVGLQVFPVGPSFSATNNRNDSQKTDSTGPEFILKGSVQLGGDKVRIIVSLQQAQDGLLLWSERYNDVYATSRLFDFQENIANKIVQTLAQPYGLIQKLSRKKLSNRHDPKLESYKCVLLAYQYRQVFSAKLHKPAKACLEKAVKSDPNYSRAWAMLTYLIVDEYRFFFNTRPDAHARASEAAKMAIKLNPDDVLSYQANSVALFGNGDIAAALDAARAAVELNPYNMEALFQLGLRTAISGDWEKGNALVQRALKESPSAPSWYNWVPTLYYYQRRDYKKAKVFAELSGLNQVVIAVATRAMIYGQLGMLKEAKASLENALRLDPLFKSRAREYFSNTQIKGKMLDHLMDGLHKAGL